MQTSSALGTRRNRRSPRSPIGPADLGHIGEFIAKHIFSIELQDSASYPGIDGHFQSSPLLGKSVNIKMYAKREGLLDVDPQHLPDYYLVLTGPKSPAMTSRGQSRPWVITDVFLFEARPLLARLRRRRNRNGHRIHIGKATSVSMEEWEAARIYPSTEKSPLTLTEEQVSKINLFGAGG